MLASGTETNDIRSMHWGTIGHVKQLSQRSIDSLTDEEIAVFIKDYHSPGFKQWSSDDSKTSSIRYFRENIIFSYDINGLIRGKVIDYLRFIGILVPFDKYSVERILEMGWAVIKK